MKSIASRWVDKLNSETKPVETKPETKAKETANVANPVRHQYRQTILNGLKGESYV